MSKIAFLSFLMLFACSSELDQVNVKLDTETYKKTEQKEVIDPDPAQIEEVHVMQVSQNSHYEVLNKKSSTNPLLIQKFAKIENDVKANKKYFLMEYDFKIVLLPSSNFKHMLVHMDSTNSEVTFFSDDYQYHSTISMFKWTELNNQLDPVRQY
ncbi:MAG: hypothetical protein MK105_10720 [Crocinitomicaceae bacterium]|nr:hypothetical protein [Crocinitomicaceae bacterium]